jgi:hypothetical protein
MGIGMVNGGKSRCVICVVGGMAAGGIVRADLGCRALRTNVRGIVCIENERRVQAHDIECHEDESRSHLLKTIEKLGIRCSMAL